MSNLKHHDTTYSGQKHDAQECPDAEAMEAACSPWYRAVYRDAGDYVGRHRGE